MSNLTHLDLPALSAKSVAKLAGSIQRKSVKQTAVSTATLHCWTAEWDGVLGDVGVQTGAVAAAGESLTVNVKKNGSSIMTGGTAYTINSSSSGKVFNLYDLIDPDKRFFVAGDVIAVTLTYTAGGGPTPISDTELWVEPTFSPWK